MQEHKLWELMNNLSVSERREVARWIKAFYPGSRLAELYARIDQGSDRKDAHAAMFPHKPQDQFCGAFRKLESQLASELERYLILKQVEQDRTAYHTHLIRAYHQRRGLSEKYLQRAHNLARRQVLEVPKERRYQAEFLWGTYWLEQEALSLPIRYGRSVDQVAVQQVNACFDQLWCIHKLEAGLSQLFDRILWGMELPDLFGLAEALGLAHDHPNPSLRWMARIYDVAQTAPGTCYQLAHELRGQPLEQFDGTSLRVIYTCILNLMVLRKSSEQAPDHRQQLIDLYRWGLDQGVLLMDQYLMPSHFTNYISLLYGQAEWDHIRTEIDRLAPLLANEVRDEVLLFVDCHYYLYSGRNPDKALEMYNFRYQSVPAEFRARFTLLKLWYERGEYQLFENELRNLQYRLRQPNLLPETTRKAYRSRIGAMRQLYRCQSSHHWQKLRKDLPDYHLPVMEHDWLEGIIDRHLDP